MEVVFNKLFIMEKGEIETVFTREARTCLAISGKSIMVGTVPNS